MNTSTHTQKYTFFAYLALFLSAFSLFIDVLIETGGIRARTPDKLWFFIFVGISVVIHMSFLLSPLFRHATGGKKHVWTIFAVPLLFLYSLGATLVGQSSFIESQAAQVENASEIRKQRLKLVKDYRKAAKIKQRYDYATRSEYSLNRAAKLLDKAGAADGTVSNSQAVELPLRLINALLPKKRKMSVQTFLIIFYTLMSFGLILIGYFFSELSLVMFDKSGDGERTEKRRLDIKSLQRVGRLTDVDTQQAIDAKIEAGAGQWAAQDITRDWIADAHFRMYGKARKGETLDKFIKPTRKKVKRWRLTG